MSEDYEPDRVHLSTPQSQAYWARRLEVPIEQLRAAVEAVGDDPAKVAERVGRPWPFNESGIV